MSEETLVLVGGPWCGRHMPLEAGWDFPDVFQHRDLIGEYVRVAGTNRYTYRSVAR